MDKMEKNKSLDVYSRVDAAIDNPNTRELWTRLRSELTRLNGGPDACLEYLNSEVNRMEQMIQNGLNRLGSESIK